MAKPRTIELRWLIRLQRLLHWDPALEAVPQGRYSNASRICPVSQAHDLSVVRNQMRPASIASLLAACAPFHVAWFIISAIVNAIKAVSPGRSRPNVRKKRFKCFPLVAHINPPASISRVKWVVGIAAPAKHVVPSVVFGSVGLAVCFLVVSQTSSACSTSEMAPAYWLFCAALTATQPVAFSACLDRMKPQNRPPAEHLSSQVFGAWNPLGRISGSHVPASLCLRNVVRTATQRQLSGCLQYNTVGDRRQACAA